jgi:hypothetical protein
LVNTKAWQEVKAIMHHLGQQNEPMIDMLPRIEEQHRTIIDEFAAIAIKDGGTMR